jgi:hypothetical protein
MIRKFALLAAIALAPVQASAAVLTVDTGWADDTLSSVPGPTDGSPWSFTLTSGAHFTLVDCCIVGDTYTLTGDVNGVSSFFAGAADVRATGSYGSFWSNASYSKFTTYLGAGSYTFNVTGDGVGGVPAGLGLRLDSSVPEPASWAMLIVGFGLVGATMRRRAAVAA